MAQAVADGARESGADVVIKRVPEIVPPNVAGAYGFKLDQAAPIAVPDELADYDGIVFGVPTRFGGMAAQMRNFLVQTGGRSEERRVGKGCVGPCRSRWE